MKRVLLAAAVGVVVAAALCLWAVRAGSGTRLVLVGVDGATFDLLDPEIARGHLAGFRRLREEGAWGTLECEIAYSPPSWTTIATGVGAATHGVRDFLQPSAEGGKRVTDRSDWPVVPVWELLRSAEIRIAVLDWLFTEPGSREGGVVLPRAGAITIYRDEEALPALEEAAALFEETWREVEPRFAAVVFYGSDHLQHRPPNWEGIEQDFGRETHRSRILEYYHGVDSFLLRLLEEPDLTILVVSDHGFRRFLPQDLVTFAEERLFRFDLNALLRDLDFLRVRPEAATADSGSPWVLREEIDWSRTVAFDAREYEESEPRIRLNLAGREPEGIVAGAKAAEWRKRIEAELLGLETETGFRLFEGPDAPSGAEHPAQADAQADVPIRYRPFPLAQAAELSNAKLRIRGRTPPLARYFRAIADPKPTHDRRGIFLLRGPDVARGVPLPPLRNADVAPTILHLFGRPVPFAMEGRIAGEAASPLFRARRTLADFFALRPVRASIDITSEPTAGASPSDPETIWRMEEKMRELGYLR